MDFSFHRLASPTEHVPSSDMQVFTGQCTGGAGIPVIGRILFPDDTDRPSVARISVIDHTSAAWQTEERNTVGMIQIGDLPLECQERTSFSCPVLTLSQLPNHCKGKIALLDPKLATLFVSPDLKTVNHYTRRLARMPFADSQKQLWLPNGKRIRLGLYWQDLSASPLSEADGFIMDPYPLSPPSDESEERLYEWLRDIAEHSTGLPLCLILEAGRHAVKTENFSAQIRGLFRAAVYGNFSCLLRGLLTEDDIHQTMQQIHKIFCALESEGREFNGYIPKGIFIHSPLLLISELSFDGIDFLCFDANKLFSFMSDHAPDDPKLQRQVGQYITALSRRHSNLKKSILFRRSLPTPDFCQMMLSCGITEWYSSAVESKHLYAVLKNISEERSELP